VTIRLSRGLLAIESHSAGVLMRASADNVPEKIVNVILDDDEVRWLPWRCLPLWPRKFHPTVVRRWAGQSQTTGRYPAS
jgi:hypothetical protein